LNEADKAAVTGTMRLALREPEALATVRLTVFDPAVVYVWLGFRTVDIVPSPKFHSHEAGVPADVSVNWTACPAVGEAGLKANEAERATAIVTVRVVAFDPVPSATVRVTVLAPAVV
jgi:hypothetical protein